MALPVLADRENDIGGNMTLPETASSRWASAEGLPFPLGPARIEEEDAYNFALYSKHAESVTLLLYTERDIVNPVLAYRFDYLKNKTGRVWHCRIPLVSMRGPSYQSGVLARQQLGRGGRCAVIQRRCGQRIREFS